MALVSAAVSLSLLPSLRFHVLDEEEVGWGALADELAAVDEGGEFFVGVAACEAGEGHVVADGDGVMAVEVDHQEGFPFCGGHGRFASGGDGGVGTLEWPCEAVHDLGFSVEAYAADTELRGADIVG